MSTNTDHSASGKDATTVGVHGDRHDGGSGNSESVSAEVASGPES